MFTLHNGDCLEYMKTLAPASVDCVITDPPYGKKFARQRSGHYGSVETVNFTDQDVIWDDRPSKEYFDEIFRISKNQIIWGANYFIDYLRPTNCMLVWDKKNGQNIFADFELAWTSYKTICKKVDLFWLGSHIHRIEKIYHPTQKPTGLMRWCVENYTNPSDTIFDPYMGSGTTGVAALQLGRNFIGCEKDPKYFAIAEKRLSEAVLQPSLFTPSNNRVQRTGGESGSQSSLFTDESSSSKVTRQSTRR